MTSELVRVSKAATEKRRAEQEYRAALSEARTTASVQEIARAAGITRQAVYKITKEER